MNDAEHIKDQSETQRGSAPARRSGMRTLVVDQNWLWRKSGLALSIVISLVVCAMTLSPMSGRGAVTEGVDKIYHFAAFLAIIFPLILTDSKRWYWAVPLVIAFGGAIELIQPSVGRTAEWLDFGADLTGVLAGAALAEIFHDRIHRSVFDAEMVEVVEDEISEDERLALMRAELKAELRGLLQEELEARLAEADATKDMPEAQRNAQYHGDVQANEAGYSSHDEQGDGVRTASRLPH